MSFAARDGQGNIGGDSWPQPNPVGPWGGNRGQAGGGGGAGGPGYRSPTPNAPPNSAYSDFPAPLNDITTPNQLRWRKLSGESMLSRAPVAHWLPQLHLRLRVKPRLTRNSTDSPLRTSQRLTPRPHVGPLPRRPPLSLSVSELHRLIQKKSTQGDITQPSIKIK